MEPRLRPARPDGRADGVADRRARPAIGAARESPRRRPCRPVGAGLVASALIVGLAGCGRGSGDSTRPATQASAAEGPPVSVSTVRAQRRDFPVVVRANGTVTPLSSVEVKPQIASQVTQVHVREGQFVRTGELLFTLDARSDEAKLAQAQAQLAKDEATLADAERQLARSRDLLAQQFVAQGAVDTAQATADAQRGAVGADRAAIEAVRVNLSYARIRAPGAGRVGAIPVYPGTSVAPAGPPLVTITQLDPIAVAFSLPQRHLGDALRLLGEGGGRVAAVLPDAGRARQGMLQFVDNLVDPNTGTVRVKARFDNADHALWPGAYVDVTLTVRTLADVVVVPHAAVVRAARGDLVYLVGADARALAVPVKVVEAAGDAAVVDGVAAGAEVVVDGRQNLRPGARVVVRDAPGAAGASPRASAVP